MRRQSWRILPGTPARLDGEEYLIVNEDEVLAVIEDRTEKKPVVIKGQTKEKTKKTTTKSKK